MTKKGFSHIGLSTLDLDKTREFYEDILGFKPVRCDTIKIKEGGRIRHIFFDTGRDQLLAFMEAKDIPDVPVEYDAGFNRDLVSRVRSTTLLLRLGQKRRSKKKNKSCGIKAWRSQKSWITTGPSRFTLRTPTVCRWNTAASPGTFTTRTSVMTERFEAPIAALGLEETPDIVSTNPPS